MVAPGRIRATCHASTRTHAFELIGSSGLSPKRRRPPAPTGSRLVPNQTTSGREAGFSYESTTSARYCADQSPNGPDQSKWVAQGQREVPPTAGCNRTSRGQCRRRCRDSESQLGVPIGSRAGCRRFGLESHERTPGQWPGSTAPRAPIANLPTSRGRDIALASGAVVRERVGKLLGRGGPPRTLSRRVEGVSCLYAGPGPSTPCSSTDGPGPSSAATSRTTAQVGITHLQQHPDLRGHQDPEHVRNGKHHVRDQRLPTRRHADLDELNALCVRVGQHTGRASNGRALTLKRQAKEFAEGTSRAHDAKIAH